LTPFFLPMSAAGYYYQKATKGRASFSSSHEQRNSNSLEVHYELNLTHESLQQNRISVL
jgi:hypothetical protein